MKQIVLIVILLALMVGSVGAVCDSRVLVPLSAEWKAACYSQEPVVVQEQSLIEEILGFFSNDEQPVSYKAINVPTYQEIVIRKYAFDVEKRQPYVVTQIKRPAVYTATVMRAPVPLNKSVLKSTGKWTGFIKGVVKA